MVRASSRTVRYASFWRTSADPQRLDLVAGRRQPHRALAVHAAVAVDEPSGSVNAYSDFMPCVSDSSSLDLEALVAERDALDGHLVGVGLQADARVLLSATR